MQKRKKGLVSGQELIQVLLTEKATYYIYAYTEKKCIANKEERGCH